MQNWVLICCERFSSTFKNNAQIATSQQEVNAVEVVILSFMQQRSKAFLINCPSEVETNVLKKLIPNDMDKSMYYLN